MSENTALFWKALFLIAGLISTGFGLMQESGVRAYGGIALIVIAFLVAVK